MATEGTQMKGPLRKRLIAAIKRISTVGSALLFVWAAPASADQGQAVAVAIQDIGTAEGAGSVIYIRLATEPTVRAGCSTHSHWHFTLDVNSAFGKATYPVLLEALASGRLVTIYGTENCYGNVELLRAFTRHG
jgi:hypothetical protein